MQSIRLNPIVVTVSRVEAAAWLQYFVVPASSSGRVETAQAQQVVEADVLASGHLFVRQASPGKNAA